MVAIFPMPAVCQGGGRPSLDDAERLAVYLYLDSCHFDFFTKPFVEVEDRSTSTLKRRYGFLVRSDQDAFDVVTVGLRCTHFAKPATFHPANLDAWLEGGEVEPPGVDHSWNFQYVADPYPTGVDYSVASWLAAKQNLPAASLRFFDRPNGWGLGYNKDHRNVVAPSRLDWLRIAVPARCVTNIVRDLTNDEVPRGLVVAEARQFLARFPDAREAAFASEAINTALSQPPPPTSKEGSRTARLVDELRDVQIRVILGGPVIYEFDMNPPYDALLREGLPAVPALINGLDDRRITKAGAGWAPDPSPDELIRVRDVACHLLNRISGKTFADALSRSMTDSEAVKAKAAARAWWGEARHLGEVPWLERSIRQGDGNVAGFADRLAALAPAEAWPTIRAGYSRAPDSATRGHLLRIASRLGGPPARSFAREQMSSGVDRETRTAAAGIVAEFDAAAAMSAMMAEVDRPNQPDDFDSVAEVLPVLVGYGRERGIDFLRSRLPRFPARQRAEIITQVSASSMRVSTSVVVLTDTPTEAEARSSAVEKMLAQELNDTTRLVGTEMGFDSTSFHEPRICELASYELAKQLGPPYRFYSTHNEKEGDALRFANMAVWRGKRGLNPPPTKR